MKRAELKKILKPLIKECVKEAILDEGILSGIISEVARGVSGRTPRQSAPDTLYETKDPGLERMQRNAFSEDRAQKLQEQRKKLLNAVGTEAFNGVDLFEGTTPAPAAMTPAQQASPLATQSPHDAGVDIGNLFGAVGRNWNAHMNGIKQGK